VKRRLVIASLLFARIVVVAVLLFAGCAVTPTPADQVPSGRSPAATPCVQACTDARRMEATGWEVIVSECEATCTKTPTR